MSTIHATAIVHPNAKIDASVTVGPYAIVGEHVSVGEGSSIGAHVVLDGHTTIGRHNKIHPFAAVGGPPQDKKYAGEPTRLIMGNGNTIREYVTINTGTAQDGGVTTLGDDNWIMAYVHIAHDCRLGSHIILANAVQLAGHVHLDDHVFLGGLTGVHQFVRVGAHAMAGFQTRLSQDVPPFITAAGNPAEATGINAEGLRRRGYTPERIAVVKRMHKTLYRQGLSLSDACAALQAQQEALQAETNNSELAAASAADVLAMLTFVTQAERGIVR
jgi:UDP-N-acetylglucosamine acyltransferase